MEKDLISCRAFSDQERVAILALKNNLKAIPVIDKDDNFLGVVSSDRILDVLHQENVEDILLAGGISKINDSFRKLSTVRTDILFKARLPWLLIGLMGGVVAAQIIGFFENVLEEQILLAFFIPVIVYMSGAVAAQTETLIIRGMVFDPKVTLKGYFFKELKIGFFLALVLGLILSLVSFLWWGNYSLTVILGLTLFLGIFLSVAIAILIPFVLQKFKKDPAMGSGPFGTIVTDIVSVTVYFVVASILLKVL